MSFRYRISGVGLAAEEPLDGLEPWRGSLPLAWQLVKSTHLPYPVSPRRYRHIRSKHSTLVIAWPRIGTFRIRPGTRRVDYALAPQASREAFLDVLLGPIVSFLLVLEDSDPLHGCAVAIHGEAVCFLGLPGAGKSTLAASFLLAGHGLLTDDLLGIEWKGRRPYVMPGYPEIRLWPGSGRRLLSEFSDLPRVVPTASKRRLDPRAFGGGFTQHAIPLRLFYELRRSSTISRPEARPLQTKEAFLAFVRNLYNVAWVDPKILERQFRHFGVLASRIPVRQLLLPRSMKDPRRLSQFVLRDLRRTT